MKLRNTTSSYLQRGAMRGHVCGEPMADRVREHGSHAASARAGNALSGKACCSWHSSPLCCLCNALRSASSNASSFQCRGSGRAAPHSLSACAAKLTRCRAACAFCYIRPQQERGARGWLWLCLLMVRCGQEHRSSCGADISDARCAVRQTLCQGRTRGAAPLHYASCQRI